MRKIQHSNFAETVYVHRLKNGMEVHVLPKEDPCYSTYVELSVPFGGLHLSYRVDGIDHRFPEGIAHFFEHKIFAMPEGDAFSKFSQWGADANAMTSFDQTSYVFQTTEHVLDCLEHVLNMVDTPYFTDQNIEQEKSIIAEELKMYLDDPHTQMQNHLMENMYHVHPLKYDIGGTLESIQTINQQMLLDVFNFFYQPKNRLLVIAGKVDLLQLKTFLKAYDHRTDKPCFPIPRLLVQKEPRKIVKKHEEKVTDYGMDRLMMGVKLGYKKRQPKDQIKRELAISMLLNMLLGASSPTFQSLLNEQLINQSFYVSTQFEKGAEAFYLYAETNKIRKLKKRLMDVLFKDMSDWIKEDDFIRYKKVYLGQFIFALNSQDVKAYLYGKYHHQGVELFEVVHILSSITYSDVWAIMTEIKKTYCSTLVYKKA